MKIAVKTCVLVGVQLVCLGFLLLTGPWLVPLLWIWLELIGFYLGAWALVTMKPRQLRIGPEVAHEAQLVKRGPYRFIRHPMYSAVLLITLALVLSRLTVARGAVWALLLGDLLAKLTYEEALLAQRFPDYNTYRNRTKRLIPFVY